MSATKSAEVLSQKVEGINLPKETPQLTLILLTLLGAGASLATGDIAWFGAGAGAGVVAGTVAEMKVESQTRKKK